MPSACMPVFDRQELIPNLKLVTGGCIMGASVEHMYTPIPGASGYSCS
jgi:hypothetical protein